MSQNPITLTRQSIYDLVWSRPMVEVAKDFSISDVALAKRCRAVDVPVPPRGYWARKAAGQDPPRTPLPKYRTRTPATAAATAPKSRTATPKEIVRDGPEPTVNFAPRLQRAEPATELSPPLSPAESAMRARIDSAPSKVADDLSNATCAIKRTVVHLGAVKVKDLSWARGERTGPIVAIQVSAVAISRALRIADAVLRAAAQVDWPFEADPQAETGYRSRWTPPEPERPRVGRLIVENEPFRFKIDERHRQVPHVLTEREQRDQRLGHAIYLAAWDLKPTGDLRLHLTDLDGHTFKTRKDTARHPLETQILAVLHDFLDGANLEKRRREEKRLREETKRERERLADLADQRREAHAKLIRELERQAGAWYRARCLRRYVRAARRATADRRMEVKLQDETVDFFEWAAAYVEQLDPLSAAPRHPDQTPEHSDQYGEEEEDLKKTLLCLFGHDGYVPWKLRLDGSSGTDCELEDSGDPEIFDEED